MLSFNKFRTVFVFLVISFALAACSQEPDDSGVLTGTWKFDGAVTYIITPTTIEYIDNYKADIISHSNFEDASGSLVIQFTDYTKYNYVNFPEVTSEPDTAMIGKYSGVYWKDLKAASVFLADPWQGTWPDNLHVTANNETEAREKFAPEKYADYGLWASGIAPYLK
jgi:hypothetical protein